MGPFPEAFDSIITVSKYLRLESRIKCKQNIDGFDVIFANEVRKLVNVWLQNSNIDSKNVCLKCWALSAVEAGDWHSSLSALVY